MINVLVQLPNNGPEEWVRLPQGTAYESYRDSVTPAGYRMIQFFDDESPTPLQIQYMVQGYLPNARGFNQFDADAAAAGFPVVNPGQGEQFLAGSTDDPGDLSEPGAVSSGLPWWAWIAIAYGATRLLR